jgi:hypothetical protein
MAKSKSKKVDEVKVVDEVSVEEVTPVVDEVETVEETVEEVVEEVVEEKVVVKEVGARSSVDILTLNHRKVVYTIDGGAPITKAIGRKEHKALSARIYTSLT